MEEFKELVHRFGLMGSSEAAACVGVQQPNLDQVAGLPEPVMRVRATRLWIAAEIEAFVDEYVNPKRARRKAA